MTTKHTSRKLLIAQEIREFLLNLPLAKHSPMGQQTDLADGLTLLESIVNRLKSFISFLSKLNPTEYLRWMHDAFARKIELSPDESFGVDYSLEEQVQNVNLEPAFAIDIEPQQSDQSKPNLTPN